MVALRVHAQLMSEMPRDDPAAEPATTDKDMSLTRG